MVHKLGIVGFGGMAGWHRDLIATIDGLEIAGVYDILPARMEYAKSLGLKTYESLEALLGEEEIELVLVATPNDVHKSIAISAMRAGKHVVSEKPITLSSENLEEMIQVSREEGVLLTVHQNRRWDEDYLTIQKIIKEKYLGEPFRIESRVHGSRGIPGDWRQEPDKGGGMVYDWGVHLLDQMVMMFPESRIKTVYAVLTNVTNQLVDDGFTAWITFDNGITAVVEVGTSNFISLPRWYVLGQDGTAVIENWDSDCRITSAVGKSETDVVPVKTAAGLTKTMAPRRDDNISTQVIKKEESDIRDFYRNVMAVLEHREEPKIRLEEVARVMRLMEAVFTSAQRK